jgi:guanine nucleotide-binding protein G(i) subunit alpha
MGNCAGGPSAEELEKAQKAKEIEEMIAKQEQIERDKVKLLLLGAGESGKSTVFKQMKLIYGAKYSDAERKQNIPTLHTNIMLAIKILCDQAVNMHMVDKIEAKAEFEKVKVCGENEQITPELGDAISALWKDAGIQGVWKRRSEYQIIESVQYYFDKMDQIKRTDFVPDDNDLLYLRVRTSGIVTERYEIDGTTFEMYDVGGQRNERKKWIHCFEGVTAVIFVAAISEYDQSLFEDASTNRMVEALDLFDDICNNTFFAKSAMILFLNKRDLFEEKIKVKKITDYPIYSDYSGPDHDYDAGVAYFVKKFMSKNKSGASRKIYHHVTCATDTSNVKIVFDSCKDIILRENLKSTGLEF